MPRSEGRHEWRDEAAGLKLQPVGVVVSPLNDLATAPKQGIEGAPEAVLRFDPAYRDALADLRAGDEVIILTWLHRADRSIQRVHPRDDVARPKLGVFATRSADRPNPIGLHRVRIVEVGDGGLKLVVLGLEAIDGTPILDLKPMLRGGG